MNGISFPSGDVEVCTLNRCKYKPSASRATLSENFSSKSGLPTKIKNSLAIKDEIKCGRLLICAGWQMLTLGLELVFYAIFLR